MTLQARAQHLKALRAHLIVDAVGRFPLGVLTMQVALSQQLIPCRLQRGQLLAGCGILRLDLSLQLADPLL